MSLEGGENRTVATAAGCGQQQCVRQARGVATATNAPMGSPLVERLRISAVTVGAADVSLIVHRMPEVLEVRADDLATSRELCIAPAVTVLARSSSLCSCCDRCKQHRRHKTEREPPYRHRKTCKHSTRPARPCPATLTAPLVEDIEDLAVLDDQAAVRLRQRLRAELTDLVVHHEQPRVGVPDPAEAEIGGDALADIVVLDQCL